MNISSTGITESSAFEPNYRTKEKKNAEQYDKTAMKNTLKEAKEMDFEIPGEGYFYNGNQSYFIRMINAAMDNSITGTMEIFDQVTKDINEKYPDTETREKHLNALDDAFKGAATFYAKHVETALSVSDSMREGQNINIKMGSRYSHKRLSDSEKIVGSATGKQMAEDIKNMFMNAKDYYDNEGTIKGLNSEIITGNSKTLTYGDLMAFSDIKKDLTKFHSTVRDSEYVQPFADKFKDNIGKHTDISDFFKDILNRFVKQFT